MPGITMPAFPDTRGVEPVPMTMGASILTDRAWPPGNGHERQL